MPDTRMIVSALSDVGRTRRTNEDAFAITDLASGRRIEVHGTDRTIDVEERGVLLALSDGMGGHQAGEVASALVLESLQDALLSDTRGAIHEQLEEAVQRANRSVMDAAQAGNRHGMGATLTAVFVRGSEAFIAEIGDSRAYLLRRGRLRQITRDQSLVQLLVDHGVLSAEEARSSPSRNVILQAVGLAEDVRVAIARLELRRGDRFLLCSDGVSNAVSDAELAQIMTGSDPRAACDTMIALANDRGGLDNQTAIVADLTGDGLDLPDEFETVTSTYEVLKAYEATLSPTPAAGAAAEPLPDLPLEEAPAEAPPPSDPGETQRLPRRSETQRRAVIAIVVVAALLAVLAFVVLAGGCGGRPAPAPATLPEVGPGELRPPEAFASIRDPAARSRALFLEASKVLLHPRCVNCHPPDDTPRQGDASVVHDPPVFRGPDDHGVPALECGSCHQDRNVELARVPGAPGWHLAPVEMTWLGRSPGQICAQLKDPARNGGKTLAAIHEHMAEDALVAWGWDPGDGRTPAPGSQAQLAALIGAWIDAGATCPEEEPR